ncbi:MAG: SH3 domain-containing protein [Rhodobacteraceae bacterium]|nr:SH3 domain-containing protein [Paracoccaceae bacterium]MCC6009179.1 SH3 domain-containing protein [Paracoccaceae bacterium]
MRLVFCTVLSLLTAPASADPLPQLFDVTGVAADDVLNVRTEPTAQAPAIGGLAPDLRGVEVTALDARGTWGRINWSEGTGWVFMRYMAARGVHIDNYNLPVGLRCFGTEPFWSLTHDDGVLLYESMGADQERFALEIAQDTMGHDDLRRMIRAEGGAVAYVHPQECSDGMSDRLYGLAVAWMPGPAAPLLSGCCSLGTQVP